MAGRIIFLNGVTSCGKTTVAECIKAMCSEPVYVFSNDIFHNMVSPRVYEKHESAFWHFVADTITAQYYAARGCADAGFTVLIDGMLLDLPEYVERFGKRNIELVTEIFSGCEFTLIDLTCPVDELRRRNIARGDRGVNQSDEQLSFMTKSYHADLTVDVMTAMPDETAEAIMNLCGLPFAGDWYAKEYNARVRRRFLQGVLKPYGVKISHIAVTDADAEPVDIALTADSTESVMAELTSRGYERLSDTRAIRRNPSGHIREIVRINEGIAEPMDYLGQTVNVSVDRPKGSVHPNCPDMVYGVNYGYVENGLVMPDGDEVDVYVLGVNEPLERCTGTVRAVIHRRDDDEDKLIAEPDGASVTREDIRRETHFCEQYFDGVIYTDVK
ncbi:MAG: AAA family ATPase [Clostridia bacterium]|nr:AAA family ATPase [Clostridia bacterium]